MNGDPAEAHLLVIDDDSRLRDLLRRYLVESGFRVTTAGDAAEARLKLQSIAFDLLIVDVMMPGESGLALTESLRRTSAVPILLLTAMAETASRIDGLERGADDYLTKPFEPRELVLRIRNILQRVVPPAPAAPVVEELQLGGFRFDLKRNALYRGGEPVHLTEAETALLVALARKPGEPVSREALSLEAQCSGNLRTVDVQMTRLRRKIERDPKFPRYLQTVRGTGYVLKPD
ncbi:MAG TPA: response regulator transcription factor [Stellaceae bacterium]|jgi:two-component system, OmpR family, phosphate regulon response regulator OmpR|nr:response regulator transcription factor [Stellaceae bacterium]